MPSLDLKFNRWIQRVQRKVSSSKLWSQSMVGFREMHGQSLVKVGQTRSNLIDGPETTRFYEIHIRIWIIGIEKYGDILVLVKF